MNVANQNTMCISQLLLKLTKSLEREIERKWEVAATDLAMKQYSIQSQYLFLISGDRREW